MYRKFVISHRKFIHEFRKILENESYKVHGTNLCLPQDVKLFAQLIAVRINFIVIRRCLRKKIGLVSW